MPCYSPIKGWRGKHKTQNGKYPIVFKPQDGYKDLPVSVSCGRCIGCKLEYSRQWALRALSEKHFHEEEECHFVTLTYDEKHLPKNLTLVKSHFQNFMKRLRYHYPQNQILYMQSGEYGEENQRPHYHAIIYGLEIPDLEYYKDNYRGDSLYKSKIIDKIWSKGSVIVGSVTFDSCAYVARYVTKKITGKKLQKIDKLTGLKPYELIDKSTGEIITREHEYMNTSRNPAIAKNYYEKYQNEIFTTDSIIVNGTVMQPPKYFTTLLENDNQQLFKSIKRKRKRLQEKNKSNSTYERLQTREICKLSQISKLRRT